MKELKKSLFAINKEQLSILNEIESLEGEITPEIEDRLIITQNDLKHKSIAYREVIAKKEVENTVIDQEIKRLQALKKRNQNKINALKASIVSAVNLFGEFSAGFVRFGVRNSQAIHIENVKLLPPKYKNIEVLFKADKVALRAALNNGEEIDGVQLVNKKHLKIS